MGAIVEARGPDRKYARTDNQGNYVFSNLAPGTYRLTIKQPAPARILGTNPAINLANDAPQQVNLQVDLRSQKQLDPGLDDHFQNHPCENGVCAPYGAPPARRRVV